MYDVIVSKVLFLYLMIAHIVMKTIFCVCVALTVRRYPLLSGKHNLAFWFHKTRALSRPAVFNQESLNMMRLVGDLISKTLRIKSISTARQEKFVE